METPDKFSVRLARIKLSGLKSDKYPFFAQELIESGFDSPALYMLAASDDNEVPSLLDQYFKTALKELGFEFPSKKEASIVLIHNTYFRYCQKELSIEELLSLCRRYSGIDGYHDKSLFYILYRMDEAAEYWSYENKKAYVEYVYPEELVKGFEQEMEVWLMDNPFVEQ